MRGKSGKSCVNIKVYEYVETEEKKIEFGALRDEMEDILGKREESADREDFCENLGDIRLEFCDGRFSAAVVPEGYRIFLNGRNLGYTASDAERGLSRFFSPLTRLRKKGSVCCERAGIICFEGVAARSFVCSREFYRRYSAMLLVMEQCEQKASFNDV